MSKRPQKHEDDDGRTVADMSGVTRPNLWSFRFPSDAPWYQKQGPNKPDPDMDPDRPPRAPDPNSQLSPSERRSYILAAVGAGLGIAAVFGIVFAIAIFIIGHVHC